jgi:hypothetical protein
MKNLGYINLKLMYLGVSTKSIDVFAQSTKILVQSIDVLT